MRDDRAAELLADIVCMVYHEGRNVRHQRSNIPHGEWPLYQRLISLPSNREQAWQQMQTIRTAAATAVPSPAIVYENKYGITIAQLAELYSRPIWRDSFNGGNKWAAITRRVQAAIEAHAAGNIERRDRLMNEILIMDHNTGKVEDKLQRLNGIC